MGLVTGVKTTMLTIAIPVLDAMTATALDTAMAMSIVSAVTMDMVAVTMMVYKAVDGANETQEK